jgi:hypothetical protein
MGGHSSYDSVGAAAAGLCSGILFQRMLVNLGAGPRDQFNAPKP